MDFTTWYDDNRSNGNWPWLLKRLDHDLYERVATSFGTKWAERAYCFILGLTEAPKCACGASCKFYHNMGGYTARCSPKCALRATATVRASTVKAKTPQENAEIHAKSRATSIAREGPNYASDRMKRRSQETIKQVELARQAAMIARYGVTNPSSLPEVHEKRRATYAARTPQQKEATKTKLMRTRIALGTSVPDHHPSIFASKKAYTRRVRYLTNRNIMILGLFPERSMELHVDHKLSISQGYREKISPAILAHPANLRLLSASENSRKSGKSTVTLAELYSLIEESTFKV